MSLFSRSSFLPFPLFRRAIQIGWGVAFYLSTLSFFCLPDNLNGTGRSSFWYWFWRILEYLCASAQACVRSNFFVFVCFCMCVACVRMNAAFLFLYVDWLVFPRFPSFDIFYVAAVLWGSCFVQLASAVFMYFLYTLTINSEGSGCTLPFGYSLSFVFSWGTIRRHPTPSNCSVSLLTKSLLESHNRVGPSLSFRSPFTPPSQIRRVHR